MDALAITGVSQGLLFGAAVFISLCALAVVAKPFLGWLRSQWKTEERAAKVPGLIEQMRNLQRHVDDRFAAMERNIETRLDDHNRERRAAKQEILEDVRAGRAEMIGMIRQIQARLDVGEQMQDLHGDAFIRSQMDQKRP